MQVGFTQSSISRRLPLVKKDFKNAMCYGQTGSGKTTGFMLPNIEDRLQAGYGLLIYDFKGTMHLQVKQIAKKNNRLEDVIEVGKLWGKKVNLLQHSTGASIEKIYDVIHGESNVNSYFKNASATLLIDVYKIVKLAYEISAIITIDPMREPFKIIFKKHDIHNLSFKSLFSILRKPTNLSKFLEDMLLECAILQETIKNNETINDRIYILYAGLANKLNDLGQYRGLQENDEIAGKYGVIGILTSLLSTLSNLDFLNENEFDIIDGLNNQKIVILNVSSLTEATLGALNISIYDELIKRASFKQSNPIAIFIDEAQKVLHKNYLPDVDLCRENRFEYIFATQDESLLVGKISAQKTEELKRNIASVFSFKTNDDNYINTTKLKEFEYVNMNDNTTYLSIPIFSDEKELELLEYDYQRINKVASNSKSTTKNKTILIHQAALAEDYRTLCKNLKENTIEICDYLPRDKIAHIKDNLSSYVTFDMLMGTTKIK
jgi:hypothetical protein